MPASRPNPVHLLLQNRATHLNDDPYQDNALATVPQPDLSALQRTHRHLLPPDALCYRVRLHIHNAGGCDSIPDLPLSKLLYSTISIRLSIPRSASSLISSLMEALTRSTWNTTSAIS